MAPSKTSTFHERFLYSSTTFKAILLSLIVLIGSLLPDTSKPHSKFFSDTNNPINQYYVKYVWGWTLLLLIPILIVTTRGLQLSETICHFGRVLVNHVIWYGMTSFFVWLRTRVGGECSNETLSDRKTCLSSGFEWFEFDISGHVFLLSFCVLVLSEEIAPLRSLVWRTLIKTPPTSPGKSTGKDKTPHTFPEKSTRKDKTAPTFLGKSTGKDKTPFNRYRLLLILYLLQTLTFLEMLLDFLMITATSLYFHTLIEKVLGLAFSLLFWYSTYHVIYGTVWWVPRRPHQTTQN